MIWNKFGLIFYKNKKIQTPAPLLLDNDGLCRVFYSERTQDNKSIISYFEINLNNPLVILNEKNDILKSSDVGSFDYSGVMPSCALRISNNEVWLYYTGWSRRIDVPYHNSIGLAVSSDNGSSFERLHNGPIISSDLRNPYFVGTPFVLKKNNIWYCWYYSCSGWFEYDSGLEPRYNIKYAISNDGINWITSDRVIIDYLNDKEGGLCSPTIIYENKLYKMFFSYRGAKNYRNVLSEKYKIGYAESHNLVDWKRDDKKSGIFLSNSGWDSDMMCYPSTILYSNRKYLFYCGNNFGEAGIGLAFGNLYD